MTRPSSSTKPFGTYDFGLSDDEEQRAARLQRDSTIIDLLFQGPCSYRAFTPQVLEHVHATAGSSALEHYFATYYAPVRAALAGDFGEFRTCWEQSGITAGNRQVGFGLPAYAIAQAQFDHFDWLDKALTATDIRAAKAAGHRAGFLSTQDSDGLQDGKLDYLQTAYDLGLRMMGLSYNVQNAVAGGCMDAVDEGITSFGAHLIAQMNALGIIIDLSHSSRQATLDACRLSRHPIVVSHASAAGLHDIPRAKGDEEIHAIATSGGVLGVAAVPDLLGASPALMIETMLDHIDYIAHLVGWQHVAIGTDWPLQIDEQTLRGAFRTMADTYIPVNSVKTATPQTNLVGFDDYRDFPNITRGLVGRGYSDEQIQGILGENFLRVFETICG